jgi:hypothetical protein
MSGIAWQNDLDVNPRPIELTLPRGGGRCQVHGGFYRNVRATRPDVVQSLQRALEGRSVSGDDRDLAHPMEALYITGHSYGGAMATLLAMMLRNDPAYAPLMEKLRAVYTYGAPMIGSPAFADACQADERLGRRVFRYVYDHDIVPQVPPRSCGDFQHFGTELRYTPSRGWRPGPARTQLDSLLQLLSAPATIVARQLKLTHAIRFHASLYDHLPGGYIATLTPGDVTSEFGR